MTSEETLDRIPKAAVQLLTEQFLENVDKSHLCDSCQGYDWDGSALEGLGAVSVDECERAIQKSKQAMVQESGDSAACSDEQFVILFVRWVIQQQREKRRQEEALHRMCVGVKRTETREIGPGSFVAQTWWDGGSHLPQAKTKSGEEEWEWKQTADTTQLQKHGKESTFGKLRGATLREVYENDLSYCQ